MKSMRSLIFLCVVLQCAVNGSLALSVIGGTCPILRICTLLVRTQRIAMPLLHFNILAMFIACVALLVGFSYRDTRWGGVLMVLGVLAVMGVIVYDIQVLSARA